MGRKINVEILFVLIFFIILALTFYYPIFLGKVPLNGNLLVAFWSPWKYLHWPGFPNGVPFKFMGVDEVREFFPLLDFTHDALRSGFMPLWNPYNFSGYPHLANWASAVFYPLHVVFFLFNKLQSFIFLKISAIILSGFFTYLYLHSIKLDRRSSFFGGVAFAFSATLLVWGAEIWQAVHSFIWLPLILLAIEKIIEGRRPYMLVGASGLAASVMGGYIQPAIYVYMFTAVYIVFRLWRPKNISLWKSVLAMFFLSLTLSAVHTFPAIEAFILSPRKEIALADVNLNFLLPLSSIVTFFVPDIFGNTVTQNWFIQRPGQYYEQMIYIGVILIILSSFAFYLKRLKRYVFFFFLSALVSISAVFNLPTSRLIYQLNLPFLSTAIPIRIIFITAFSLSILSAFGLSWWLEAKTEDRKNIIKSLTPLIIIYALIGFWLLFSFMQKKVVADFPADWFVISIRNFVIPAGVFLGAVILIILGTFIKTSRQYVYLFLMTLLIIHSFIFAQKYFSFTDEKFIYPSHPMLSYINEHQRLGRYFGYGDARLVNNLATVYKIYSPEGYDPVNIKLYNELLSSANTGDFRGMASRSDAVIPGTNSYPLNDENILRLKLLDLLGVKLVGYYTSDGHQVERKMVEDDRFKLVWQEDGFMVFENKKAFDRAFLVPDVVQVKSKEEAIRVIYDPSIDLSQKAIVTEEIKIEKGSGVPTDSVDITAYTPNKVVVKASTNVPQLLVLSDVYYPGWQASIDGVSTKIYPAYHALRAVVLQKGNHEVVFEYKSQSFFWGAIVSAVSLLMALCILLLNTLQLKRIL